MAVRRSEASRQQQREANKRYQREARGLCKARGICVMCRKAKAKTGRTMCLDCLDQVKITSEWNRSQESKDHRRAYNKKKVDLCVALGVCRNCQRRDAVHGQVCEVCKSKRDVKALSKSKKALRQYLQTCTICGNKRVEGYRVCQRCLSVRRENLVKARNKCDRTYWKSLQTFEVRLNRSKYDAYRKS